MKKLLLFFFFTNTVCAMDQAPAAVAMSDDAPSFISKEWHKHCCGVCCASVGAVPSACIASYCVAALRHSHQECGNWLGCDPYQRYRATKALNPMSAFIVLTFPPTIGYLFGSELGEKTHRLDQRLKARLTTQKEKSE